MLTLSGGGTFTISDAPTAYTMAGASGGTMQAASSELTGKALTDSTTGGTTTVKISDIAAGGATVDADALAADVLVEISG